MRKRLYMTLERIYRWFVPRKPKLRERIDLGSSGPFDDIEDIREVKPGLWRARRRRR